MTIIFSMITSSMFAHSVINEAFSKCISYVIVSQTFPGVDKQVELGLDNSGSYLFKRLSFLIFSYCGKVVCFWDMLVNLQIKKNLYNWKKHYKKYVHHLWEVRNVFPSVFKKVPRTILHLCVVLCFNSTPTNNQSMVMSRWIQVKIFLNASLQRK